MAIYAAQIDRMDQGIGKVIKKIKELGKKENTLVMFLSDNGACAESGALGNNWWDNDVKPGGVDSYQSYGRCWANASNTPFRYYKKWIHEGGIATPFIAKWPKVIKQKGAIIKGQPGHIIDVMATCCDIANTSYPESFNDSTIIPAKGKSLLPIFKGKNRKGHDIIYWEHMGNVGVREGNWKLVAEKGEPWELYDLSQDPVELN